MPAPFGFHLPKHLPQQPQLHRPPEPESKPIWCMSRGGLSAEDIRGLTEAIQKLTVAVETLTERLEDNNPGDWELVEEEHRPPGFEEPNLFALHSSCSADTGPPKVPAWVLAIAGQGAQGRHKGLTLQSRASLQCWFLGQGGFGLLHELQHHPTHSFAKSLLDRSSSSASSRTFGGHCKEGFGKDCWNHPISGV